MYSEEDMFFLFFLFLEIKKTYEVKLYREEDVFFLFFLFLGK